VIMDLSALVQGATSSGGLNDELAQQTPAGENVFKKAFGDRTSFKTQHGTLTVTFLFDPDLPFDSSAVLASITTDYMAEMKYQLTKLLVGEKDMAPRIPSLEEVVWTSFKKNLPPQAFSKDLLSDKKELTSYLSIIRSSVEASYKEESKLTGAMVSQPYHFVFRIAIDAYPQKLPHSEHTKMQPGQKNGVLVFIIENKVTDKKETSPSSDDKQKETEAGKEKDKTGAGDEKSKAEQEGEEGTKKRKKAKGKDRRSQKESTEELLRTLLLKPEDLDKGHVVSQKEFPETATDFFDQIGAWYSSVVASKQQQLDQQASKPHMYQ